MSNIEVERPFLTREEQIAKLNSEVKCVIAPSSIQGVGVFAVRDIHRGEKLYCVPNPMRMWYNISYGSLNKLFPEIKEIILSRWPSIINGSLFQSPNDDAWLILFMNHSDNPNYEVSSDSALRDIKKGEEITEDYSLMKDADKIYTWLKKKA